VSKEIHVRGGTTWHDGPGAVDLIDLADCYRKLLRALLQYRYPSWYVQTKADFEAELVPLKLEGTLKYAASAQGRRMAVNR
jgi:hypothetical protein